MPANLTQRLLCAARHAYDIDHAGPVAITDPSADPPGQGCIGYIAPPVGVNAGLWSQDAGFVAAIPEGPLVSIRGTTPFGGQTDPRQAIIDWAGDAVALLEAAAGTPPGFPGRVHFGFYKSFMRVWARLQPFVDPIVKAHPSRTIYVTGHSKGGAICALVAWRLKQDYPDHQIVVRAFAPARIGDDAFAAAYAAAIPDHIRYEYDDDLVPHLPLEPDLAEALGAPKVLAIWLSNALPDYRSVGALGYIRQGGAIVPESAGLEADRVARLIARLAAADGPAYVAGCHGISNRTDGYVAASYPG